jgi:tripartite-type tricarboxylate transporter receptor subunit TctC
MRTVKIGLLAMALAFSPTMAVAQTYPAQAVHWMIPFPPGGGTDLISRTLTRKPGEAWGVQVIADNRPGAKVD